MEQVKQFFKLLPTTWWGITIIVIVSVALWLLLSVLFYRPFFKRLYDLIISIIALPFFLLFFIPIAIAIKCEDKGPVFYCGERLGKNGRSFKMMKFRSMKVNAPDIRLADGSTFNGADDDRVTKVGKFLRKTSLDEIPQILNIFIGQMSLIGPRPDPIDWLEKYTDEQKVFLKIKPGITGYNQAYFRNSVNAEEKINNDIFYSKKISLILDVKIFFKTVVVVLKQENLFVDDKRVEDNSVDEKE